MFSFIFYLLVSFFSPAALGAVVDIQVRQADPYAPVPTTCPRGPLVRAAQGLSSSETRYLERRKSKASKALASWLQKTHAGFCTTRLPVVALTTSGGGLRSLLEGAGVVQGFDARDSHVGTSGLYQALTYHAGLSGGSWLLSSIAGNNYPTITSLRTQLWEQAFQDSLLAPDLQNATTLAEIAQVIADVGAKRAAGFNVTLVDPYGRLLSQQLLEGPDGGVATRLSSITQFSNFTKFQAPYPIITALGVKTFQGECLPGPNATQYELHPYEYGSWDAGVRSFTQTEFLGSKLNNGKPLSKTSCFKNYDNLGYVLGTSSALFADVTCQNPANSTSQLIAPLAQIIGQVEEVVSEDLYAQYPNPFRGVSRASLVSAQPTLDLVDGGLALQNNPIWPFIQHAKRADVLIVNDNSADTSMNFPNGSEILTTYVQAQGAGLTRMPFIPSVETFIAQGLNQRATFFGCDEKDKLTIVYLPNKAYTFNSGQSTFKLEYTVEETRAMIANGIEIATQNGTAAWPTCLGCAIVKKTGEKLPRECTQCFNKYCYQQKH